MRVCEDCGKPLQEPVGRNKLCPECKKKHVEATRAKYREVTNARKRQKAMLKRYKQSCKRVSDKQIKCCDTYCHDCDHYSKAAGYEMCNYMLNTGKRRPCLGGTGCTVRKISQSKRRTA